MKKLGGLPNKASEYLELDLGENNNELSENAQAIVDGFTTQKIKDSKEEQKEKAREKIYHDVQWNRINEEEAQYLFDKFNL